MFSKALIAICFAAVALGTPVARDMQVHETREHVPAAFTAHGPASADTVLNLRFALVSSDMAGLEKALMDVSTPSSPLYGQHLSKEEVRFHRPLEHSETRSLILGNAGGAVRRSVGGDC